jgi:SAM-dependent methyltransferase
MTAKKDINPTSEKCPSCGSTGLKSFYKVNSVPVHSCVLKDSKDEALSFPEGSIDLGFCPACGFITNMAYDIKHCDYSTGYEDQQSFSATFNAFARGLAEKWVEKYDLHNKKIIEIGCGKGDFLRLICQIGDNHCIGIDPAFVEDRVESAENIVFIRDYYSEKYGYLKGDMICCRHTLEHIDQTAEFLRTIRKSIGDNTDTLVFFEIPDAMRVLKEQAFWDIYYEHCSYFTPGSLGRLFRAEGFEILDLYTEFEDQYLIIETKASAKPVAKPHPSEEAPAETEKEVLKFEENIKSRLDYWMGFFNNAFGQGRKIAIWGSGSKCVAFMTTLGLRDQAGAIVDINPHRHAKFIPSIGKEIVDPQMLKDYHPDIVVIMNPIYRNEIAADLKAMGLDPELTAV